MNPFDTVAAIFFSLFLGSLAIFLLFATLTRVIHRCRGLWPFHVWSRWGSPYNGTQTRPNGEFGHISTFPVMVQSRWCVRCGAVEHRIENVDVKLADVAQSALPRRVERQ